VNEIDPEITVVEAIAALRADGFTHDFSASDGKLRCGSCEAEIDPASVEVVAAYRFEGESDPDDEAAVFGVRCGECGISGIYVVAYGPSMSAEDARVVPHLSGRP
jgi:hypothetical protein